MLRVLGLIVYMDDISIICIAYKNLKIQYSTHKVLVDASYVLLGMLFIIFQKKFNSI
jgi:hypothetical protein